MEENTLEGQAWLGLRSRLEAPTSPLLIQLPQDMKFLFLNAHSWLQGITIWSIVTVHGHRLPTLDILWERGLWERLKFPKKWVCWGRIAIGYEFSPGVQIESLSPHGYSIRRCYGRLRITFSGRLLGADKIDCVCSLWIGWSWTQILRI